jgi:hypothetical protein
LSVVSVWKTSTIVKVGDQIEAYIIERVAATEL